jgi:hypothetical protein
MPGLIPGVTKADVLGAGARTGLRLTWGWKGEQLSPPNFLAFRFAVGWAFVPPCQSTVPPITSSSLPP